MIFPCFNLICECILYMVIVIPLCQLSLSFFFNAAKHLVDVITVVNCYFFYQGGLFLDAIYKSRCHFNCTNNCRKMIENLYFIQISNHFSSVLMPMKGSCFLIKIAFRKIPPLSYIDFQCTPMEWTFMPWWKERTIWYSHMCRLVGILIQTTN